MPLEKHTLIENWSEDDLLDLPESESDAYEYKSSLIRESSSYRSDMSSKITKTASALWNTGGGILIVGVDDSGHVDGGIPYYMGKQKLRDWVDMVLNTVTPVGPYTVRTIKPQKSDTKIDPEHVVLVIAFGESFDLPHMAPDNRYYIRTGAHSNPANHYLVEAIRARRGLNRPMLRALLRENPQKAGVVELTIVTINDLPALNVLIDFMPIPPHLAEQLPDRLPLTVSLIDRSNPFRMDIATMRRLAYWLGDEPFQVILQYEGVRGELFKDTQYLDHLRSLGPSEIRLSNGNSSEKLMQKMLKQIRRLNGMIETLTQHDNANGTKKSEEMLIEGDDVDE